MAKQAFAKHSHSHSHSHLQLGIQSWEKPPNNVLKCNVDVVVLDSSHFGYDCIINSRAIEIVATHGILSGHFNSTIV